MRDYRGVILLDSPVWYATLGDPSPGGTLRAEVGNNGTWGASTAAPVLAAGAVPRDRTGAASFDGGNDGASVAINVSAYSSITVEFWLWVNAYSANDKMAMELGNGTNQSGKFYVDPHSSFASGSFEFLVRGDVGNNRYTIPRPTAAAWHHYVPRLSFANAVNEVDAVYVDGVAQPLTAVTGNSNNASGTTFRNDTLNLMCRNGASLFSAGRMQHVAIYAGLLGADRVAAHYLAGRYGAPRVPGRRSA